MLAVQVWRINHNLLPRCAVLVEFCSFENSKTLEEKWRTAQPLLGAESRSAIIETQQKAYFPALPRGVPMPVH
jgi:hypothetical protein